MADQFEHSGNNSKRKKMIVAALLALFLVVVILRPTGSSPASSLTSVCDGNAPPAILPLPILNRSVVEPSILPLPDVDLRLVLAHDPFRGFPGLESQAKSSEEAIAVQSTLDATEITASPTVQSQVPQIEIPVTAIVTGGKRSAALIGERLYYENDVLENGWLIVAIKSSSILVESAHN